MGDVRVAFCGASGTGKTTLAKWLSEKLNVPMNPVGSRSVTLEMGFASPYDVDAAGQRCEFQHRLQAAKVAWEREHASFVTDRTTLDELAYTVLHGVEGVDEDYLNTARKHCQRYTHVFYCPEDVFINLGDDPQRLASMTYQSVFDAALQGMIAKFLVVGSGEYVGPGVTRLRTLYADDLEERKKTISEVLRYTSLAGVDMGVGKDETVMTTFDDEGRIVRVDP